VTPGAGGPSPSRGLAAAARPALGRRGARPPGGCILPSPWPEPPRPRRAAVPSLG